MGSIGGLLGTAGGVGGTGINVPSGTNATQINNSYNANQASMEQQQKLLNAMQAQNGLGNQSQVYNQLQGVVSGQGPNPAQAMLNQSTQANVANQAALMAGQRGAGANVGLMARQAGQQGMQAQQQAAGQGASMQAEQALNAMGQAGNMANTMATNQIGQTNANTAAQQNEQGILQGANSQNNQIMGGLAGTTMQGQQGLIGGLMNAAGAAAGKPPTPHAFGGKVNYAEGGSVPQGPQSNFAKNLWNMGQSSGSDALQQGASSLGNLFNGNNQSGPSFGAAQTSATPAPMEQMKAHGGEVAAMVSPGELILTPEEAKLVAEGRAKASKIGARVPGKASVEGDSYSNDSVPARLPEGGVVVKRTKAKSDESSGKFVRDVLAKKGRKK